MNFEEEKYPTLPAYDSYDSSSTNTVQEERESLVLAVRELEKIKSEMEARIRLEYEDKLRKETYDRKEKEEYMEFQKYFEKDLNIDQRSKNIIDHVVKVMEETPVFILYNHTSISSLGERQHPKLYVIITSTNLYKVEMSVIGSSYLEPLYKFDKKLSLNESKFLNNLLREFLYPTNRQEYTTTILREIFEYINGYESSCIIYKSYIVKKAKQIENIIKLFPGKYQYDGWEKVDIDIFRNDSLVINKKEMKIRMKSYLIFLQL
jgi:hypothetical protein